MQHLAAPFIAAQVITILSTLNRAVYTHTRTLYLLLAASAMLPADSAQHMSFKSSFEAWVLLILTTTM